MALNTMPVEQWNNFKSGLNVLAENLGEKKKKNQLKTQNLSDDVVFKKYVLPGIYHAMQEIEQQETRGILSINVKFAIITSFAGFNLEQMLIEHSNLVAAEDGLKALTLFVQYSRGLLYIELVDKLKEKGQGLKEFVEKSDGLNVSHMTILRYMTLASIISTYPRLILCQLSFTQILKHKNRLLHFLMNDEGQDLNSKLSLSFEIMAHGKKVKIERVEMKTTDVKFSTDPDWMQHDLYSEAGMSDRDLQALVASRVPEDEEDELQKAMMLSKIT